MRLYLLFCSFAFFFLSCKSSPEDLIIGKWKSIEDSETFEFSKDGTVTKIDHRTSISGNYQWLDSYRLKLDFKIKGSTNDFTIMRILISEKELVLINQQGKLIKYQKAD